MERNPIENKMRKDDTHGCALCVSLNTPPESAGMQ